VAIKKRRRSKGPFRLKKGESSSVYLPGQFVSAEYAARYRHKVVSLAASRAAVVRERLKRIQRELEQEARAHPTRTEDWELTIRYMKGKTAAGPTMRITVPFGTPRDVVLIVAKRAGMPNGSVEKGFAIHDIDWQSKSGKVIPYGDDIQTGLQVSGWTGLLAAGDIRLDKVKE